MNLAIPEPGQLVELRRRQWVVADVQASALIEGNGTSRQHLVSMVSLDEDSFDETLEAIWELEPGARILETAGLPRVDGWDTCDRLEAFLDAVRWGATTNADRSFLQAPFRSGVEIQDFQLDPLVRAVDMARVNLLIADDVGLGKTIEAGLVVQELLIRHRARSVLVVCPASLQVKWQTEMRDKFGLEFRIVDTEYVRRLRRERGIHANPWTSFPRLIASMDWAKSGEGLRLIKDVLPPHATFPRKFDILIVDEAHNVAPASASWYAMPSQRTRLIRTLAPHFEHRLFLTATPHNGDQQSFTSLLEMLDNQRFVRGSMPDEKQKQRVMVRRLKTDLVDKNGDPIYATRCIEALEIDYSEEEREIHRLLKEYTSTRLNTVEGSNAEQGTKFVQLLLKRRLFSSPMAFALTLAKHRETLAKGKKRRSKGSMKERILRKAILRTEEDYADDAQVEDALSQAVEAATEAAPSLTETEKKILDRLSSWAEQAKYRADSKAEALFSWLDSHLKTNGEFNDKRVILFTEYRATHSWLMEMLTARGWGGDRLMALHGGTDLDEREKIKAAFQAHPGIAPVRILLATDAASEGIDLQNHCNYLIHIEFSLRMNVMEQRNGRIDRHGQKQKEVFIWHPVAKGLKFGSAQGAKPGELDGDLEFLMRAAIKQNNIREDLGCVGPVIERQIEEALLGKRVEMDTREAEAKAGKVRKLLGAERRLQERVARLHERLIEARDGFQLTPERVARAVSVAMDVAGKPPLKQVELDGTEEHVAYEVPLLTGSWGEASRGLPHPHTGTRRPITFDHGVAISRDDVVLAHLEHRLVQLSLRLLRAEVWAHEDLRKLQRVAVRTVPDEMTEEPIVIVWSRLVITGAGHHRLHEELTIAGGELKENGFARIRTLGKLDEFVSVGTPTEPSVEVFDSLRKRFSNQEGSILKALQARSGERLAFLGNTLERRRKTEEEDLNTVLDGLEAMIQEELKASKKETQLELWPLDQREQLRRDVEALRKRLERIPYERKEELKAIAQRYESPVDRTFPVAVEFIIPASFTEVCS